MITECEYSLEVSEKPDFQPSKEVICLARFMVWAYDEVNENLQDDVLRSAIKAILYYMSKRYGVNPSEAEAVIGRDAS